MRTLSSTLESAQQARSIDALVKIVLTEGQNTHTYTRDRILDIDHKEQQFDQKATVLLDDSDGVLGNLALKGYKGVISYGAKGEAGAEYSACAPLYVINQRENSLPGVVTCALELIGIPNLLAEDHASESYLPEDDDSKTVKDIIDDMFDGTMTAFDHCATYTVTWDSEDSLIDSFQPKDSFRIYTNGTRLAALRRLLDYTKCCARFEDDGEIHIFQPTISGGGYDYEYSLVSGHTFFSKAYRSALVMPNYVVVKSQPDDDPSYTGYSEDTDSSDLIEMRYYKQLRLASNDQAGDIAEAILSKFQLWAKLGAADVPINVGAEVLDYVKVTDERATNNRIGNIGSITRKYTAGKGRTKTTWNMTFSFGDWIAYDQARSLLRDIETYTDEGSYFNRLWVKDLYAENIQADNIDLIWMDSDGNIDLSQIGDTLDSLPDGSTYARVLSTHLDAGGLKVNSSTVFAADYDPTDKFDLGDDTLDNIPDGSTYKLVLSTDVSAGHIYVGSHTSFVADYDPTDKFDIGDDSLDDISDGTTYERIRATNISGGNIKLTSAVAVDGTWYSTGGVEIDSTSGIIIDNEIGTTILQFLYDATYGGIYLAEDGSDYYLTLVAPDGLWLPYGHILPTHGDHLQTLGDATNYWYAAVVLDVYFKNLVASTIGGAYGNVDFENAEWMDFPSRTAVPTGYEGRWFFDNNDYKLKLYANGSWQTVFDGDP